jgi:hypothetical protein
MAADDIYLAEFHFEGPTSAASTGLYYQEDTGHDAAVIGTTILAESLEDVLLTPFKNVLSDDWWLSSITVRLVSNFLERISRFDVVGGVGLRTGPALPANMAWLCKATQSLFGPKHNGRIYIPGLAETDTTIGVLTNAFATTEAAALATALATSIAQISAGTGVWSPGIINRTVLNFPRIADPEAALDWEGAFSPIATLNAWTIISSQRRRVSRVVGAKQ